MSGIKLEEVTKIYPNGVQAVDDLDLEIFEGEFVVLVGPSGCGKSTLLRMLAGLEDVSGGALLIDDVDVTDMPPQERDIAMVFQNYALYPHMTVRDNLAYGLKLRKMPKAEWKRKVQEVATTLGLEDLLEQEAGGAVRRPAAARGDGTRDRARAEGVPDGRAALEPRREAARLDARRAREAARAARRDDGLRDARPGRGDDARPARRGDARRRAPAGRHAAASLPPPGEPVRRRIHRLAVDEPRRRADRRRPASRSQASRCRSPRPPRSWATTARSSSASGRPTSSTAWPPSRSFRASA